MGWIHLTSDLIKKLLLQRQAIGERESKSDVLVQILMKLFRSFRRKYSRISTKRIFYEKFYMQHIGLWFCIHWNGFFTL